MTVATYFLAVCILLSCAALGIIVVKIWKDIFPLLEFHLILKRTELRLDIQEAGFVFPEWLEEEDKEENSNGNGQVLRLVPKETSDS